LRRGYFIMEVICLETEAFYTLIEEVVGRLREKENTYQEKWIQTSAVMDLLGIKSKTTLHPIFPTSQEDHTL